MRSFRRYIKNREWILMVAGISLAKQKGSDSKAASEIKLKAELFSMLQRCESRSTSATLMQLLVLPSLLGPILLTILHSFPQDTLRPWTTRSISARSK